MKIFLDTADIDEISKANTTGMIEGITTNPTLIKRSGRDPVEVIKEISSMSNQFESVSAEVVADTVVVVQSLEVDLVTGCSYSSKAILLAIDDAISN